MRTSLLALCAMTLLCTLMSGCRSGTLDDDDTSQTPDDDDSSPAPDDDDSATADDDDSSHSGDDDSAVSGDDDSSPSLGTSYAITSGGGDIASANHRARVVIGAPQPQGKTGAKGRTVTSGVDPGH